MPARSFLANPPINHLQPKTKTSNPQAPGEDVTETVSSSSSSSSSDENGLGGSNSSGSDSGSSKGGDDNVNDAPTAAAAVAAAAVAAASAPVPAERAGGFGVIGGDDGLGVEGFWDEEDEDEEDGEEERTLIKTLVEDTEEVGAVFVVLVDVGIVPSYWFGDRKTHPHTPTTQPPSQKKQNIKQLEDDLSPEGSMITRIEIEISDRVDGEAEEPPGGEAPPSSSPMDG